MIEGPGLGLSRRFYRAIVAPILKRHFPDLRYAAARIGLGSEVLGYDTAMSADHDFGPAVQLFLIETDFSGMAGEVMRALDVHLPESFEQWAVRFPANTRPPAANVRPGMLGSDHGVELYTLPSWCDRFLQRQFPEDLGIQDWLCYPEQLFLIVTAGAVFHDDIGELQDLRRRLAYFPTDVWLYKLAAQWGLIAAERAYVGRSGGAGDEIGSRVLAARMVENIMRLGMLIERRYAPYPKWFGTAFSGLRCAVEMEPILRRTLSAEHWQEREASLVEACRLLAALQVANNIPGAIAPTRGTLHARPFQFIDSPKISTALRAAIADDDLRQLPDFGAADQLLKNNAVVATPRLAKAAWSGVIDQKLWWA